jgi:hypothetical protein
MDSNFAMSRNTVLSGYDRKNSNDRKESATTYKNPITTENKINSNSLNNKKKYDEFNSNKSSLTLYEKMKNYYENQDNNSDSDNSDSDIDSKPDNTNTNNINNNNNNVSESHINEYHKLKNKWIMYAHMPHDTDWTIDSYKQILQINYIEELIALIQTLPEIMVKNCMLFFMRDTIKPIWEDPRNSKGGCFSYKVHNKDVYRGWKNLCYSIAGESISSNKSFLKSITGASISPKKNFCIIKIWVDSTKYQNTDIIKDLGGLDKKGVLFKTHKPEY